MITDIIVEGGGYRVTTDDGRVKCIPIIFANNQLSLDLSDVPADIIAELGTVGMTAPLSQLFGLTAAQTAYSPAEPAEWIPTPTSVQDALDQLVDEDHGNIKQLTNNASTDLIYVSLPPNTRFGCKLFFMVQCADGVDQQIRGGDINAFAINDNGTLFSGQGTNASTAVSTGTLTLTFAWALVNNVATLSVTPASSLTPSTFRITYHIFYATEGEAFYSPPLRTTTDH